jgi:hypothetical protein
MTGHGTKFPRKAEQALAALLTRPSIDDAAGVAGVSEKTLRRWLQDPGFNARYLKARRDSVQQAAAWLQQATGMAAATLRHLMTNSKVPPAVRLRAAELVFSLAFRGIELEEIVQRLVAVEEAIPRKGRR